MITLFLYFLAILALLVVLYFAYRDDLEYFLRGSPIGKPPNMKVESPLVSGVQARYVGSISCDSLIPRYAGQLSIDVSDYFKGLSEVAIYECPRTGYRFYHPFSLTGREDLYQHLQQFDYNYKRDKWEYQKAASSIPHGARVLDVGCGEGAFLSIAAGRGLVCTGLELNSSAVQVAKGRGLDVQRQFAGEHAVTHKEFYDAVCSFQVLEHISDVSAFISDCLRCLKPGGLLIIGVPNNDGFLKYADAPLNAPPHHMGLWTRKSLESLAGVFPLTMASLENEPLAEIDWYLAVQERRFLKINFARRLYHKLGVPKILRRLVAARADRIAGHTILATYRKTGHL
jgi:SAM-dependent methyltransferase